MNYKNYEVPSDLKFDTIDLERIKNLNFSLKIDKKYFADILEKPNEFTSVAVTCAIIVNQKDIFVNGKVYGKRSVMCARCNDMFTDEFEEPFNEILSTKEQIIDIMSVVLQTLALTENINYVCNARCQGLCDMCGVNKNKEKCSCTKEVFSPFAALKK